MKKVLICTDKVFANTLKKVLHREPFCTTINQRDAWIFVNYSTIDKALKYLNKVLENFAENDEYTARIVNSFHYIPCSGTNFTEIVAIEVKPWFIFKDEQAGIVEIITWSNGTSTPYVSYFDTPYTSGF